MADAGQTREAILERLAFIRDHSHLYLTPATLKYLQMSGRVGKLQGAIASLLNVKPVIALQSGVLEATENVRTRGKALDRILTLLQSALGGGQPINAAVIHARTPDEAEGLLARLRGIFDVREALMEDLVASLAVHGGPGVIAVFAYPIG
jgi:DegV family protein with EDD domain